MNVFHYIESSIQRDNIFNFFINLYFIIEINIFGNSKYNIFRKIYNI